MKRHDLRFAIVLTAGALALRLFRLGGQSLWVDELLTYHMSAPKPGLTIVDYVLHNIHGPLHAFIVYLFQLVSSNDAWLRLPSALAGAAGVFYLYRWVRIWLDERTAKIASVMLAIHPLHIYYSQELRNYSLLFFFAMFASYHLHRLFTDDTVRGRITYALSIVGAALSNFSSAFLYLVHTVLYLGPHGDRRRRVRRWAVVAILITVLLSPWIYRIYVVIDVSKLVTPLGPGELETVERLRGESTLSLEAVPFALYAFSVGYAFGPSLRYLHENPHLSSVLRSHGAAVTWVAVVFGVVSIFGLVRLRRKRRFWSVVLYLTVPFLMTLILAWQNAKAFNVRYVLLAFPAYLCIVAAGLQALPRRAGLVATGAVMITLLIATANYFFNGNYARENVRDSARFVARQASDSDCVFAPAITEVFEHYYTGSHEVRRLFAPPGTAHDRIDERLAPVLSDCDTLWYVRARAWTYDPDGYVSELLHRAYPHSEVVEYEGVTVERLSR
ncbi:MAG: glycosyltransferase family 39 protein [bacterium]|nr:glycosyltransferase family 39 protein [bacterium]